MVDPALPSLTDKQRVFVEEYLMCWNATEAARRAGYAGNDVTLAAVGSENLRKPLIAEAIKSRLSALALSADEVLARLSDQARADLGDFFSIGPRGVIKLDLKRARDAGKLHLLKKYSKGRGGVVSIEVYDAQAALVQLGRHLKLFTDLTELSGDITVKIIKGVSLDDL